MINNLTIPRISYENHLYWHKLSYRLYLFALNQKITDYTKGGIYLIYNKSNRLYYIGSTSNFKLRCQSHYYEFISGNHYNYRMQKDWNTYGGKKAFHFVPLEIVDRHRLVESEQGWLDIVSPPYNIKLTAERNHGTAAEVSRQIHSRIRGIC